MPLAMIEEAVDDLQAGRFAIVVDDEDRENEGDLVIAAKFATPAAVNFMAREGRGLICVAMTGTRLDRLGLPLMVPPERNRSGFGTAFTLSVEAREGVTTGISAHDRARTIAALIDPVSGPGDLVTPGHVFPLRARDGGVLERPGQTEAGVDLAKLAGLTPAAVICEIMAEDGTMARRPELEAFAARHGLRIVSVADLIAYRRAHETGEVGETMAAPGMAATELVQRVAEVRLPTAHGAFRLLAYSETARPDREPHLALVRGDLAGAGPAPLVRLHSECLTGDVFGSGRCDCGSQLDRALAAVAAAPAGAILYLRQEGRGIGLLDKLRAYELQEGGLDTVEANERLGLPADARDYQVAAAILRDLGVARLRLLTNNPRKVAGLADEGLAVLERVPLIVPPSPENRRYLEAKRRKLGHLFGLAPDSDQSPEAGFGFGARALAAGDK
ncbi:MAG: 3,4-dihydroxy-2-butanone-4-phosphate synthase [Chloroflexota bacterium]|nr:3,4-dihydroxy-2-butanone-4-phosphate synthase [Chloroflexota bacterium]